MSRARRWMSALAMGAVMVSGLGACRKPATGLRVLVTTDFLPSSSMPQLHSVMIRVTSVSSNAVLHEEMVNVLNGSASLPLKFGVFLTGAPNERVRIEAEAHTVETQANPRDAMNNSTALTAARVVTGFVEGQIRVVPMVLYRGCWDSRVRCEPNSTCGPTAMCESAQRDPNLLPTYDRDAGDPTDVFSIPMDASVTSDGGDSGAMDVLPPVDGMLPPLDGMLPPLDGMMGPMCAAPTVPSPVEVANIANGTTADPQRIDLLVRAQPMVMGMPSNGLLELVWAAPSAMIQPVFAAQVSAGAITRAASATGSAVGPSPIEALSAYSTNVGIGGTLAERAGVFAAKHDTIASPPMVQVSGAYIEGMGITGGQGYPSPVGAFSAGESFVWTNAMMMANPVPSAGVATTMTYCVPTESSGYLHCYRSDGAITSFFFRVALPMPASSRAKLVAMTDSMGAIQFLLELNNNGGVQMCSVAPPGGGVTQVTASCTTIAPVVGEMIVPGSVSGQWINGMFNCAGGVTMSGGWWGAFEAINGGTSTLRAGRFTGRTSPTELEYAQDVAQVPLVKTALGLAPGACEMLVSRIAMNQLELRRSRIGSRMSTASSAAIPVHAQSALRSTALAPRSGTVDEHYVSVVDPSSVVRLYRVAAPCM